MAAILYKQEFYEINGILMEVHRELGSGFLEVVYKDAIEYELKCRKIPFEREREYEIAYKSVVLKHHYYADFVVMDKIILEVKAQSETPDWAMAQTINYLKASGNRLGIIANFGVPDFRAQRVIFG